MAQIKVLLVDDEERFLKTTQTLLRKKGFDVFSESNGFDAIDWLTEHQIDVVVLDVKMPGMDGIETLRAIRRIDSEIEVILLTGHAMVDTALEGLAAGANDYVMKPTDITTLSQKIEMAYEKSSLAR